MYCRTCGFKLDDDAVFCMNCGIKISEISTNKFCMHCGNELDADSTFCMSCGNKIHNDSKEDKTIEIAESASQESQQSENSLADESLNSLNEKSESTLDYKDISVNGRHFLYLDDSTKVFCPKCKKRVDSASTLCSWCNTSFMTDMNEKSNYNSSMSQPIVSEYYEEKRTEPVAYSTESPAKSKAGLLVAAIFIALAICGGISISKNFSTPVQNSSSSFTSSDTFNFDVLRPYTFNYSDEWDSYEFDCYNLNKKSLEDLWNNLPRYVIYNGKKRELNIKYIDYFDVVENSDEFGDAETILKKYNVIIVWDNYDGSYYHFGGLQIRKGRKGMYLYPKSN